MISLFYGREFFSYFNKNKEIIDETAYNEKPVKVITQNVELTPNNLVFEAVGTGKARQSVNIYSSAAEEVTGVFFNAQDYVDKGKVLVQLDDREEKLALKLAEVKLKDSKSLLNRYEQAVKEGAVPESEVDSARADVDSAEVALEQARLALMERKVIAPFSGVVGISRVDPGDRVNSDTLITGLDDRKIIYVDFEVPEALAGVLNTQQTIIATTPAHPGHQFSGLITSLESRVDPDRRTIMTRASIENIDDLLRPGMSFTTKWKIKGSEYPTVPEISLQWNGDNSFVWIIRNGESQKVSTQVIARRSGMVLLKGDLSQGEPVVVEGLERLREGSKVTILGEDQPELEIQVQK
ncbi:MAG: efflux RND transporter periplasmic adaptor subunit [Thermodesulfobacteriota bacterium]